MSKSLVSALAAVVVLIIVLLMYKYHKRHKNEARKNLAYLSFVEMVLAILAIALFLNIESVVWVEAAFACIVGFLIAYTSFRQGILRLRYIRAGKPLLDGWEKESLIHDD